jgi:hypothetical protein
MKTAAGFYSLMGAWLIALSLTTSKAAGQFMLSPVSVSETGLGTFSTDFAPLGAMIDQSGLKVPFNNGLTDFDSYFAPPNTNFSKNADKTKWQSDYSFNLPFGGLVDFDLGNNYRIGKAAIWNVSIKDVTVQVSASTNGPWQDVGQFSLSDQQASLSLRATVLDFGAEYEGRYVRLSVTSEYPVTPRDSFGYVIVGEFVVRAAPVDQPKLRIFAASNGDVTLTFPGFLQSSVNVEGPFEDVPGNPQGTYSITKTNLSVHQFFRTRN